MYRCILVPLDGSERAEKALPIAREEARCHGAALVLLRVVAPLRDGLMLVPSVLDQVKEHLTQIARDYVDDVADHLRDKGLSVEAEVLVGPPAERILEFAEDRGCDLIIIGSHGQSDTSTWRFGSVANKIIKAKASMPVLIVNT